MRKFSFITLALPLPAQKEPVETLVPKVILVGFGVHGGGGAVVAASSRTKQADPERKEKYEGN